jgi:hypothetical protein
MTSWMLGGLALLLIAGCASTSKHLSVPLTSGEIVPVVLHTPKAWACDPIEPGRLTCKNITEIEQVATIGTTRYHVPPQTSFSVRDHRDGVWL